MNLVNPFCPVAQERSSKFFVAESPRTKLFMDYVLNGLRDQKEYISIVGDYGQGKSRMLFYILNHFEMQGNLMMAFVSIKHVAGNISGDKWQESLFREILNQLVNDLLTRYSKSRPEISSAAARIKEGLVPQKHIKTLKKTIQEKNESGDFEAVQALSEILNDVVKRERIDAEIFFETFLPKLVEELKKIGIDRLCLLFDEMDHLHGPDKRNAYQSFVMKFRDPMPGVSVVLSCASKIWLQVRSEYPEFAQVYDPSVPNLNIIPRYDYQDLDLIVKKNLADVNQEEHNPFNERILRSITRYYSNLRDMIKIIQEMYHEYIKNNDIDVQELFREKLKYLVDTAKITRLADETSAYLSKGTSRNPKGYRQWIEQVLQSLAFEPKNYESDEAKVKSMLGSVLGGERLADLAFNFWLENNYLQKDEEGKIRLNTDKFSKQNYIGQWETAYLNMLWDVKDPKTGEVKLADAKTAFSELANQYSLEADYFDDMIDTLIEREKISKREDSLYLKFQKETTVLSSIESLVKAAYKESGRTPSRENYSGAVRVLLSEIAGMKNLAPTDSGYLCSHSALGRAKTFKITGKILFWLPQPDITSEKLRKEINTKIRGNDFVYVVWPYTEYGPISSFIDTESLYSASRLEGTKVKDMKLLSGIEAGAESRAKFLIVFPRNNISPTWKFALIDYLTARERVSKDIAGAQEYVADIDKNILTGFTNSDLLKDPEMVLVEKLDRLVPTNVRPLKSGETVKFSDALESLFKGNSLDASSLGPSEMKTLVETFSFLEYKGAKSAPREVSLSQEAIGHHKGLRLPRFVIRILEEVLPTDDYLDIREIVVKSLASESGYELIDEEFGKKARLYYPSFIVIMEALRKVLPDVVMLKEGSDPEKPEYKKSGEGFSLSTLQRYQELTIPLLKKVIEHGNLEKEDASALKKEVEDISVNLIPKLIGLQKHKKSTAKLLEEFELSHVKAEKCSNLDRLRTIEEYGEKQQKLLTAVLDGIPSVSEVDPDYFTMDNAEAQANRSITVAVDRGLLDVPEEKGKEILVDYLSKQEVYARLRREYETLIKTIKSCKEEFAKIKHLGNIPNKVETKDLLSFLGKAKDLRSDLKCIQTIKTAKTDIGASLGRIGDTWLEVIVVVGSDIRRVESRTSEWVGYCDNNRIDCKKPSLDPSKLTQLMERTKDLKNGQNLLSSPDSKILELYPTLAVKYVLDSNNERLVLSAIYASLEGMIDEEHDRVLEQLKPYQEFAKRQSISNFSLGTSEVRILQWANEKKRLVRANQFRGLREDLGVEANDILLKEKELLRTELVRKLPEKIRSLVGEAMTAIAENRILKYVADLYAKDDKEFEARLKILCDLEEVGLIRGAS